MIEEKFYREKEGRDPSIYLGIDGNPIPFEYFKGMFSESGNVYTDDAFSGIQFLVSEDEKSLLLITRDPDLYITKEDAQSTDIWHKIMHSLVEGDIPWSSIDKKENDDPYSVIQKRYYAGETGLLEVEQKKFNDKGEYMRTYTAFDTGQHPDAPDKRAAVLDQLMKHSRFVYYKDGGLLTPTHERRVKVRTNSENILELEKVGEQQLNQMKEMYPHLYDTIPEGVKFTAFMFPGVGHIELEQDDSLKDMIVTRIDI